MREFIDRLKKVALTLLEWFAELTYRLLLTAYRGRIQNLVQQAFKAGADAACAEMEKKLEERKARAKSKII